MTIELIIAVVGVLGSATGIILALRKAPHESNNLDADTIKKYIEGARIQQDRYNELEAKFDAYKQETDSRIASMQDEMARLSEENQALKKENQSLKRKLKLLSDQFGKDLDN